MDVVAEVGDSQVILIEDKVHSAEHSNQLARYLDGIKGDYPGRTIVPVYLKTGEQSSYAAAKEAGWHLFRRRDLLEVLRTGAGLASDILRDFTAQAIAALSAERA